MGVQKIKQKFKPADKPHNKIIYDRTKEVKEEENRRQTSRPQTSRPQGDRPQSSRPQSDRPQGDRPQRTYNNNRPQGDRPQGDRPQGDRPPRTYNNNRPQGDRPQGQRPPYNSNRPQGDRPQGQRPAYNSNRPQGDRPQGQRPYNSRPTIGGGYNKHRDGNSTGRPPAKKRTDAKKDAFALPEITEKTPKKRQPKKDKIVVTFDTDKLEKKSKKSKKVLKEEIAAQETTARRNFDFTKKTKQKKLKYQRYAEKERVEKIEEKLQNEIIKVPSILTVQDLADVILKTPTEIIMKLMNLGVMATINQELDFESAALVAADYDITLEIEEVEEEDIVEVFELDFEDDPKDLKKRAPVVT